MDRQGIGPSQVIYRNQMQNMPEMKISRQRAYQLRKQAEGKCVSCGSKAEEGMTRCTSCREANKQYLKICRTDWKVEVKTSRQIKTDGIIDGAYQILLERNEMTKPDLASALGVSTRRLETGNLKRFNDRQREMKRPHFFRCELKAPCIMWRLKERIRK